MNPDPRRDTDATARLLAAIAAEAGRLVASFQDRSVGHRIKEDGSPTTGADLAAERLILDRLREAWPDIPAVAEESARSRPDAELFFLVDPLDGTKDYLSGRGEYSVNIALVAGTRPVAAAIAAPGVGRVWAAGERTEVADVTDDAITGWRPAATRPVPRDGLVVLGSRRHGDSATEQCLAQLACANQVAVSSAYKFCLIASGEADLYVRCGPTMEWDTAAGDHLVAKAGGRVIGPGGRPLTYGHAERGFLNGPFAAVGDPALAARLRLPDACPE